MEIWFGTPTSDYNILICLSYCHVLENKLKPKPQKANFLGFNNGVTSNRLWCPLQRKIIVSKYVMFNEILC